MSQETISVPNDEPIVTSQATGNADSNADNNGTGDVTNATANAPATEPVAEKKKRGPQKGSKKSGVKIDLNAPSGGFQSENVDGFECKLADGREHGHRKLKPAMFADPLAWFKWQVWYYQTFLNLANKEKAKYESLGKTAEERNANVALSTSMDQVQDMLLSQVKNKAKLSNVLWEQMLAIQAQLAAALAEGMEAQQNAEQVADPATQSVVTDAATQPVVEPVVEPVVQATQQSGKRSKNK